MTTPLNHLGSISLETFFAEYWQQKPIVFRQLFPNFVSPISADELAGLSYEEEVNARIVIEQGGRHPWEAIYGPMTDETFAQLPQTHWSLLVNDVEKCVPESAWIVDAFRFIPDWQLDDLMVSYAPEGGSVGPHFDLYDVFIVQGQGHRRWQVNTHPINPDNQHPDTPLRIQANFEAEHTWVLAPGDVIYIPPNVSHYGVALDDCMSFSVGFKAISHADLANDFMAFITRESATQRMLPGIISPQQTNPGEITSEAIASVRDTLKTYLDPKHPALAHWFGRFVSENKTPFVIPIDEPIQDIRALNPMLTRNPASHFAYTISDGECALFIDGTCYPVSQAFAELLCNTRTLVVKSLHNIASNSELDILLALFNAGQLIHEH